MVWMVKRKRKGMSQARRNLLVMRELYALVQRQKQLEVYVLLVSVVSLFLFVMFALVISCRGVC